MRAIILSALMVAGCSNPSASPSKSSIFALECTGTDTVSESKDRSDASAIKATRRYLVDEASQKISNVFYINEACDKPKVRQPSIDPQDLGAQLDALMNVCDRLAGTGSKKEFSDWCKDLKQCFVSVDAQKVSANKTNNGQRGRIESFTINRSDGALVGEVVVDLNSYKLVSKSEMICKKMI
jgi:outer membrane murein-binding lipoprotein Lpp